MGRFFIKEAYIAGGGEERISTAGDYNKTREQVIKRLFYQTD